MTTLTIEESNNYTVVGAAPAMEDAIQLGDPNYSKLAREECNELIRLLRAKFGYEPEGASLGIIHQAGGKMVVVCHYTDTIRDSYIYALACEGYGPQSWMDDEKEDFRRLFIV